MAPVNRFAKYQEQKAPAGNRFAKYAQTDNTPVMLRPVPVDEDLRRAATVDAAETDPNAVISGAKPLAPAGFRSVADPLAPVTVGGQMGRSIQPIAPQEESWADKAKAGVADAVSYMAAPLTENANPAMKVTGEVGKFVGTGLGQFPITVVDDPLEAATQADALLNPVHSFSQGYNATADAGAALMQGDLAGALRKAPEIVSGYGGAALSFVPAKAGASVLGAAEDGLGAAARAVSPDARQVARYSPVLDAVETGGDVGAGALRSLENVIVNSTRLPRDAVRSRIVKAVENRTVGPQDRGVAFWQALESEFAQEFPEGIPQLREQLVELGAQTGPREKTAQIVGDYIKGVRESQTPYLEQSAARNLGAAQVAPAREAAEQSQVPRLTASARTNLGAEARGQTREQMEERLRTLGREGYEPLLDQQIDPDRAGRIQAVLNGPGMGELGRPLRQIAAGEGIDLGQMIQRDPLRAAHWMQHRARQLSEENAGTALGGAYANMRSRILRQIDDLQAPDGRTYADLRAEYGDEVGIGQALNAGNRFGAETANPEGARAFIQSFQDMTQPQQQAALASIRDWVIQKVSGGQEGAPARIAELTKRGVLEALDQLGGGAAALARDLRGIRDESAFWQDTTAASRNFGAIVVSPEQSAEFVARFGRLTPEQQGVTLGAIREWIGTALRNGGEDTRARITNATKAGVLDTLERLGPQGQALADDLRVIRDENRALDDIDFGINSKTVNKAQALGNAPANRASGIGRIIMGNAVPIAADVALMASGGIPFVTAATKGPALARKFEQATGGRKREDLARLLTAPVRRNVDEAPPNAFNSPTGGNALRSSPAPAAPMANALTSGAPDNAFADPQMGNALTTPPNQNAFAPALVGSAGGGTYGYNNAFDMDGDGEISEKERYISGAVGTAVGGAGGMALGNMLRGGRNVAPGASQQTFGGINAKTADKAKLARAQEMDAAGADRRAIWDATGWFKGADGKWRFEIDDSGSGFRTDRMPSGAETTNLSNVLEHDAMFGAYPDSRFMQVRSSALPGIDGSYNPIIEELSLSPKLDTRGARSTALHENQHAIQEREGFAAGGNLYSDAVISEVAAPLREALEAALATDRKAADTYRQVLRHRRDYAEADAAGNYMKAGEALLKLEKLERKLGDMRVGQEVLKLEGRIDSLKDTNPILANWDKKRVAAYKRLAGEVEARNVQTRRDFTPAQRRAQAPWETQDVPDDQQIVRFGSPGPQMSMGNAARRIDPETPPPVGRITPPRGELREMGGGGGGGRRGPPGGNEFRPYGPNPIAPVVGGAAGGAAGWNADEDASLPDRLFNTFAGAFFGAGLGGFGSAAGRTFNPNFKPRAKPLTASSPELHNEWARLAGARPSEIHSIEESLIPSRVREAMTTWEGSAIRRSDDKTMEVLKNLPTKHRVDALTLAANRHPELAGEIGEWFTKQARTDSLRQFIEGLTPKSRKAMERYATEMAPVPEPPPSAEIVPFGRPLPPPDAMGFGASRSRSPGPQMSVKAPMRNALTNRPEATMDLPQSSRVFGPGRPDDLGFITSGERALTQLPKKFADAKALTADQWRSALRAAGTSNEGFTYQVDAALASFEPGRKITRAELEEAMARSRETLGSADQWIPKPKKKGRGNLEPLIPQYGYDQYVAPGRADNYQQETLTSPTAAREGYKSHNWQTPGVVGHNRTTQRQTVKGERVMHVEELQSDLHQEGARYGYRGTDGAPLSLNELSQISAAADRARRNYLEWRDAISPASRSETPMGIRLDYDANTISSATGREYYREAQEAIRNQERAGLRMHQPPNAPMEDWEGPLVQRALLKAAESGNDLVTFPTHSTLHTALQNEGTKKFYDERLPRTLERIAKALGAKVEMVPLQLGMRDAFNAKMDRPVSYTVPAIRLTPEAKKKLAQGIVMYGGAGVVAAPALTNAFATEQGAQ